MSTSRPPGGAAAAAGAAAGFGAGFGFGGAATTGFGGATTTSALSASARCAGPWLKDLPRLASLGLSGMRSAPAAGAAVLTIAGRPARLHAPTSWACTTCPPLHENSSFFESTPSFAGVHDTVTSRRAPAATSNDDGYTRSASRFSMPFTSSRLASEPSLSTTSVRLVTAPAGASPKSTFGADPNCWSVSTGGAPAAVGSGGASAAGFALRFGGGPFGLLSNMPEKSSTTASVMACARSESRFK